MAIVEVFGAEYSDYPPGALWKHHRMASVVVEPQYVDNRQSCQRLNKGQSVVEVRSLLTVWHTLAFNFGTHQSIIGGVLAVDPTV